MKPVVHLLRIKTQKASESPSLLVDINEKVMETMMICVQDIVGQRSLNYWMSKFHDLNVNYLHYCLIVTPSTASTGFRATYEKVMFMI